MSEPADSPRDQNYILSQAEFRRETAGIHLALGREIDGLRQAAGWLFVSLAFWLLIAGYGLIRGAAHGR